MNLTGEPDRAPMKVGLPVADLNGGTWGIIAVLMALQARHTTGRGQYLDVSLLEAQMAWHIYAAGSYLQTGREPTRSGTTHPMIAPYRAYQAADGWLIVTVGSQKLWRAFCAELGLDIADDPRFADNAQRVAHRTELDALIEPVVVAEPVAHWLDRFAAVGIPAGPINRLADLYEDPWVAERDQIVRLPHPTVGTYQGTGFPVHASDTQPEPSAPPPVHGQHTAEVLAELGYDPERIERLQREGIVHRGEC